MARVIPVTRRDRTGAKETISARSSDDDTINCIPTHLLTLLQGIDRRMVALWGAGIVISAAATWRQIFGGQMFFHTQITSPQLRMLDARRISTTQGRATSLPLRMVIGSQRVLFSQNDSSR